MEAKPNVIKKTGTVANVFENGIVSYGKVNGCLLSEY